MKDNYLLMHKDVPCGLIAIDRDNGALTDARIYEPEYAPFMGSADLRRLKIWWDHRAVPGSRKDMQQIIRNAGCSNSREYLAKNLALSITDTYWVCPVELDLKWDDVKLFNLPLPGIDAMPYHHASSYDPNASLGGQQDKYWDFSSGYPMLIKKAYAHYGQQSVNEAFAAYIHHLQDSGVDFVDYEVGRAVDGGATARCKAFTSEDVEFIPAYEVLMSHKKENDISQYDDFIEICSEHGLEEDVVRRFMDYQTLTDFVISNIDEHLQNFGLLRDTRTLKLISPAPIFDSGNSMFFSENRTTPLSRTELLERKISSLHTSEEKMLSHIRYRDIVRADRLPEPAEVNEYYVKNGIAEAKAEFIAGSYENKLRLLDDFQNGITISLFNEKQKAPFLD